MGPTENETLDDLRIGGLKIFQGKKGYRFSLDPVLLCAFSRIDPGESVVDLGTGSGIIPLLLARRTAAARLVGVEVQPSLAQRARRSVHLNGLEGRVEIVEVDLRRIGEALAPQGFAVVMANPPFRKVDTGRLAPATERAEARHELAGGLADFLKAAAWLLGEGGRFYIIFLAERLTELLARMREVRLEPKRIRPVQSREGEAARLVLVEGRKGGGEGVILESPLVLYEGEGYSAEVRKIYEEG